MREIRLANMYLDCDHSPESFKKIQEQKERIEQLKKQIKQVKSFIRKEEKCLIIIHVPKA